MGRGSPTEWLSSKAGVQPSSQSPSYSLDTHPLVQALLSHDVLALQLRNISQGPPPPCSVF